MIVRTLPETVAGPDSMENVTGKLDDAEASSSNGSSLEFLSSRDSNVIVWSALATLKVLSTSAAGW